MFILQKSNRKSSSRRQINIRGVQDDVLILPGNQYRLVLQVSSINFELKSEAEQDALIEIYQSVLNSLACPIQILVRIRELDMDKYLQEFSARLDDEPDDIYRTQIENYSQFVKSLVSNNKILARNFYVVIASSGDGEFETIREQLALNADIVAKGLTRLGMQSRQLSSMELLDLFYSFYNPSAAKNQPITAQTMELLSGSYL